MSDPSAPDNATWGRPAFEAGGGDAFIFYAVYADANVSPTLDVSETRHRTRGLPDGVVMVVRGHDDPAYTLADFALGASDAALRAADDAVLQFVIGGSVADPSDLLYLRDVIGVVAALLDAGATAVFDLQTLTLFSAAEFRDEVLARDEPDREAHIGFLKSTDDVSGLAWLHTRGMRKFGRPDISIRAVPEPLAEAAARLLHRFAELEIRGARIPEGTAVVMEGWPEGYTCHHGGSLDDPEFNNVHVELRGPSNAI